MEKRLVLSVEDNDADFYFIKLALEDYAPDVEIIRCVDGQQAIEFFSHGDGSPLPDLLLLDRHLPHKDGFEVLSFLNSRGVTAKTSVVLFTSAATGSERAKALELGAREVVLKTPIVEEAIANLQRVFRNAA